MGGGRNVGWGECVERGGMGGRGGRVGRVGMVGMVGMVYGGDVLESGTHRLSRRAASHAESWLPGRPGSRVAGNRGGSALREVGDEA